MENNSRDEMKPRWGTEKKMRYKFVKKNDNAGPCCGCNGTECEGVLN